MTPPEPLHWATAEQLGRLYRTGECSPVEVVDGLLDRIDHLDSSLHAYVHVDVDGAREAAREAERELRSGNDRGPLHGVPVAVKDLCAIAGAPHRAGSPVRSDVIPDADATVVARLRAAGAVILGASSMTEGAYTMHHPSVTPPRNPWDSARWTGISSSGSGVATAAGLCVASLGSDTGGSIRFPSAACGLVGLKPTYGRVPLRGVALLGESLDHVGPMTRRVADAAMMLDAIAGHDPADPTSLDAPAPGALATLDDGVRGLRIGIDRRYATDDLDPTIVDPILACADVFGDAGAVLTDVTLPGIDEFVLPWLLICASEGAAAHRDLFPARRDEYGPALAALLDAGHALSDADVAEARAAGERLCTGLATAFDELDMLLCPTIGVPIPPALPDWSDQPALVRLTRFTLPFNLTGQPTISLPCGVAPDGMPLSLQLVGRRLDEAALCRAGQVFAQAGHWRDRHPRV